MSINKIIELDNDDLSELDAITASIGSLINLLVEKELITEEEYYEKLHTSLLALKKENEE